MAARALRLLRRPLHSLSRSPTLSSREFLSSSLMLSSPVCSPSWMVSERTSLHPLRTQLAPWVSFSRHSSSVPGRTSGVISVSNPDQYNFLLKEAKENEKLAVVYFTAKWCGPCRHISPVVNALSEEFKDVKFLKVDLDEPELQMTVDAAGISAVPTFQFHSKGKMVSGFSGADSTKLREKLQELL